ncbi:hypothetical protein J6Q66_07135 [bacterium]|nr:hypothetical protein [bacterium]
MVDSRSLNAVTSTSAFNFKSGDISGTAAKLTDEKMGQGSEYFLMGEDGQQIMPQEAPYIDRSAQLRATLNSLAMMNVANLLTNKKKQALLNETVNTEEPEITEETEEELIKTEDETNLIELQEEDEDATIDAILEEIDRLDLEIEESE